MLQILISLEHVPSGAVAVEISTPPGSTQSAAELMAYFIFCDVLNEHMRDAYHAPPTFDCTAKSLRNARALMTKGRGGRA